MNEDRDLFTGAGGADPPQLPVEPLDPVLVAEVLDTLTTRQHALERAFDALNRRVGAPTKEGPWTWRALGPTQTRVLFGELRDWVDWLTVRYELRGEAHAIAACWYRHPVAVEELTALMVAWRGAYVLEQAPPGDTLIHWHDRWLWPTLNRLNTQLRVWAKCTADVHQEGPSTPPPTDSDHFAGFLDTITAPPPPTTGGPLTSEQVLVLLERGEAVGLLPSDKASPIRHQDTWYAIPVEQPPDMWYPVRPQDAAPLDALLQRRLDLDPHQASGSP